MRYRVEMASEVTQMTLGKMEPRAFMEVLIGRIRQLDIRDAELAGILAEAERADDDTRQMWLDTIYDWADTNGLWIEARVFHA